MEKIKSLLSKLGGSQDLVNSICEEMDRYASALKRKYDAEFDSKLKRAKHICLEEVDNYQAELARKVGIFLESKSRSIDEAAERQRLNEEAESATTLRRIAAMATGSDPDAVGENERSLQAALKSNKRLERLLTTMREEREKAVVRANNLSRVAENSLEKNRKLELKVQAFAEGEVPKALKKFQ